ncbi:unnamed protein product [Brassicogethes aeneus]|uniref:Retrovirus-related Pol polyprotein from transposon TNT 1-94 n=1 Tax=Brassicogethes aeneus TaxID=1431903 RepID=A0A9P0BHW5_BRAAE|nr:unnamed protein product [Brassicogethes aeneus]
MSPPFEEISASILGQIPSNDLEYSLLFATLANTKWFICSIRLYIGCIYPGIIKHCIVFCIRLFNRIRAILSELDVIKVIDSETPDPLTDEWIKSERIAKSMLVEYLADSFLGFAKEDSTTKEILQNLDTIYERKSLATQLALRKKLLSLKLQGDTSLIQHFTMFDDLVGELLAAGAKLEETDKVSHLLLTLPNSYDGVITAIETLSEDSLSLAFVKTRLLDHEVKLSNENRDTSRKVLLIDKKSDTPEENRFKMSNIPKRHNQFPKFHQQNKFKGTRKASGLKCHHCGRKGHFKRDCFYNKKGQEYKTPQRQRTVQTVKINCNEEDNPGFAFMVGTQQHNIDPMNKITFILDSGASDHIINRSDLSGHFSTLLSPVKISVAKNGQFISATKKGSLEVTSNLGIQGILEDVLYCPEVPYNLLSVTKMQNAGMTILFNERGVEIAKDGKMVMKGKPSNNIISLEFKINIESINNISHTFSTVQVNYEIWHQRLGHIGKNKFIELKNKKMIEDEGLIDHITVSDNLCDACIKGKQTRLPFNKHKDKNYVKRPLFIVHSDVCGPITPSTVNEKNYFVLFVDQFTHYCVTYLIKNKSDTFSCFKDYVAKSEGHFNLKIVNLYCDNGGEYLSSEMKHYCMEKGISYHLTIPRTPQLNGVSERMVRTITEKARTMINGANLEKVFWGEAVLTATYLINITPTRALKQFKTPYELWHNKRPHIKYLKVFGSTVYVHNKVSKTKFQEKSWKGILLGYEPNGYKVWEVESQKFVVVRDVIVDETNYLISRPVCKGVNLQKPQDKTDLSDMSKSVVKSHNSDSAKPDIKKSGAQTDVSDLTSKSVVNTNDSDTNECLSQDKQGLKRTASDLRKSERIKQLPSISYNEDGIPDYLLCAQSIICSIPTSYQEIRNRDDRIEWERAISDEINSLLINNTWTLVQKPENKNIVDCKWVFSLKNNEFGNPIKYKARLVAKGFSQKYHIDYNETFAPVARISSFRFVLAFANQHCLLVHHMDVKTAFLNGKLKEEIYMKVPEGIKSNNNQVCKLNKALYGLKQAARCWFEEFEKALKQKGFKNSPVDRCLYILDRGDILKNIYVILYVDDIVIVTANSETMNCFKYYLINKFLMVDLKNIKLFLGIRISQDNNQMCLDQSAYIKTILNKFNMNDCKPVNSPLESKLDYIALNSDETYDAPCRNAIGCLMYLMICTRPDLSVAVNILSRFMNKCNNELWKCIKRVLRYLKGSIDIKLNYTRRVYNEFLVGFVDSDWGGSENTDRKSTTGYLFQLFENCTICWNTKRQNSVAVSSTEAEYMALFEAVKEALWLK